ncbi:MAG: hypothetical protein P4L27_07955 [Ignavibacteriaceae bacterium]|nr:hypothetical protein [Ignavibacteriaceae bacterium]
MIHSDTLYGVSMWSGVSARPYIDFALLNDLHTKSTYINYPLNQTGNYGGNEIVGLTAYNKKVFGSSALTTDFIYDPNNPDWIYNNLPSGLAQADELFPYNNTLFGGYYNKPELVVSFLDTNRTCINRVAIDSFLVSIKDSIGNQHRIRSFAGYTYGGYHYIFFSTCAYEDDQTGTTFLFKYVMETGNIYLIGKMDSPGIDNLEVVPGAGSTVYIYGVSSNVFVKTYDVTSDSNNPGYFISQKGTRGAALVYHSPYLYVMCTDTIMGWHQSFIRKYTALPINNDMFDSNFTCERISKNYCDGGKMVFGNDGYIYAFWRTSEITGHANCVFKIDPNNLSSFSVIAGSDTTAIPDDDNIILQIGIDKGDLQNLDLYLGGYRGVFRAYKSY